MENSKIFNEARRLHALGFALIHIHQKSKRPVASGWTTGSRLSWAQFEKAYIDGQNIGVRLGEASKIGENYLTCIDLDIKDAAFREIAVKRLNEIMGNKRYPQVVSGGGNGSRHVYCVSPEPFKMITVHKEEGWELCVYSQGRQMILPPSLHQSGKNYKWAVPCSSIHDFPVKDFSHLQSVKKEKTKNADRKDDVRHEVSDFKFTPEDVELDWLPISDHMREQIVDGTGVTDRSGALLPIASALVSAGLSTNAVLSVLTNPETFIGRCSIERRGSRHSAAQWVYQYTLQKVESERSAAGVFDNLAVAAEEELTEEEAAAQAEELLGPTDWKRQIIRGGQNGDGPPKSLVQNVVLILGNEVAPDLIKRDEFAFRDTYSIDTPWGGKKNQVVHDDDVANIKFWLGITHAFEPKKDVIYDALTVLACQNSYDPVRDMLDALPTWDGRHRLDSWLIENFEAEGDPEYLAQVFRKWMTAMVLRIYRPGAKVDWMPIFEGPQGIGKSSFGRILVGDKHFLDWLPNLSDKDSALSLQGFWAVELGELSQFRRNELESIKAFITRTVDKVRPPYGRRLMEIARRCVFFGTTNRSTYLVDETGNRRFKPVVVGQLDLKALKKDRVQLFAEAKHLFDQKIETELTLELTGKAKVFERKIHGEKMIEDDATAMKEEMQNFIEKVKKEKVKFDFKKFKLTTLFGVAVEGGGGYLGPLTKWKFDGRNSQFAAKMLKQLGGESRTINGKKYWKIDSGEGAADGPLTGKSTEEINSLSH